MKKIIRILTTLTALACSCVMLGATGLTGVAAMLYGDVDNNGSISLSDIITLNKFLAGKGVLQHEAASDVNANGVIDAVDVEILSDFLVHIVTELPYTK